ncbi:hypothetical protein QBC34DRAFT_419278 [Podospora aff. communis PSN243]|uniref:Uncharacterized protein n=1 Tax=Podospora aff. communis PSN243 TaxID=3040156 RepID=A0AAV9G4N7_9PEZI|nr:hypothetical protein QBC34DRAFT_419278 [Podospora aff. communis PSN243]
MAPDTLSLAGKTAIITGSGRENGIGAAIARALARNGANVVINYVSPSSAARAEKVKSSLEPLGAKVLVVQADVSTPQGAAKLVKDTLDGFATDTIDILVNNAGSGGGQGTIFLDLKPEEVHSAFANNTFSTIYVTQAAVPYMPRGGRIVNVGSIVSRLSTLPGVSVYGASKAAQEFLTRALATEFGASKGITVNTVAPGPTVTDATGWYPDNEMKPDLVAKMAGASKADRMAGTAEEIADAVLLVVSEQARWITGQYVAASGGMTD